MDLTSTISKLLKLSTPAIFTVALASGLVVLEADKKVPPLDFSSIRDQGQAYLNSIFILSFCFCLVKFSIFIFCFIRKKHSERLVRKTFESRFTKLTPHERSILSGYIKDKTRSYLLDIVGGEPEGLIKAGIIYQSSSNAIPGIHSIRVAHNITDEAWDYLNDNLEIVGLSLVNGVFVENKPADSMQ